MLWCAPLLIALGFWGGFLDYGMTTDWGGLATLALIALFAPSLGEELFFRVLLIPRTDESRSAVFAMLISITAFVAWHPFQALIFGASAVPIFLDPWFLVAVAALGTALARIYRATMSLWPCVAVHWAVVVGWKAFFGGPPSPFL